MALKFGNFGREEGALVLCHRGGGLNVKLLKRTAKFEEKSTTPGPPIAQSQKLNIPKKTKIYVDQTLRERDNAVKMHQTFQRDMFMLRLKTAQEYVKTLDKSINPIATTQQNEMLKLSAEVQGFGPTFRLILYLQCVSTQPIINLYVGFLFNTALYEVEKPYIPVGMLVPGIQYPFQTKIQCLSDKGLSDDIKVYVCRGEEPTPIIAALITMPVSDVSLID